MWCTVCRRQFSNSLLLLEHICQRPLSSLSDLSLSGCPDYYSMGTSLNTLFPTSLFIQWCFSVSYCYRSTLGHQSGWLVKSILNSFYFYYIFLSHCIALWPVSSHVRVTWASLVPSWPNTKPTSTSYQLCDFEQII